MVISRFRARWFVFLPGNAFGGTLHSRSKMHKDNWSRCLAVVVAEHAAEAVAAGDVAFDMSDFFARLDKIVAESLMVTFVVIMCFELRRGPAQ